jgi:hypothetical protein
MPLLRTEEYRPVVIYTKVDNIYNIDGKICKVLPLTAEEMYDFVMHLPMALPGDLDTAINHATDKHIKVQRALRKLNSSDVEALGLSYLLS